MVRRASALVLDGMTAARVDIGFSLLDGSFAGDVDARAPFSTCRPPVLCQRRKLIERAASRTVGTTGVAEPHQEVKTACRSPHSHVLWGGPTYKQLFKQCMTCAPAALIIGHVGLAVALSLINRSALA